MTTRIAAVNYYLSDILVHDSKLFLPKCTKMYDILFLILEMWDKRLELNVIQLRDRLLFSGGGKGGDYVRREGHYFFSLTLGLGRVIFWKMSFGGGLLYL